MHRITRSYTKQAKRIVGVYNGHRWLWLGQQRILILARVRQARKIHLDPSNKTSFLSVAWTMTDYDGTTQ